MLAWPKYPRFNLRALLVMVGLVAVGIKALMWAGLTPRFAASGYALAAAHVLGCGCIATALGMPFGRGVNAAKIGVALGLWLVIWYCWEVHIIYDLADDSAKDSLELRIASAFYFSKLKSLRYLFFFTRGLISLLASVVISWGANRAWRRWAGKSEVSPKSDTTELRY